MRARSASGNTSAGEFEKYQHRAIQTRDVFIIEASDLPPQSGAAYATSTAVSVTTVMPMIMIVVSVVRVVMVATLVVIVIVVMVMITPCVTWVVFLRPNEIHGPIAGVVLSAMLAPIFGVPGRHM